MLKQSAAAIFEHSSKLSGGQSLRVVMVTVQTHDDRARRVTDEHLNSTAQSLFHLHSLTDYQN